MTMIKLGWKAGYVRGKQDDDGSANPDPTMKHPKGSPKGENMPPLGGESISPAGSKRPSRPNDYGAAPADKMDTDKDTSGD